jgi:hypothetical protein
MMPFVVFIKGECRITAGPTVVKGKPASGRSLRDP